MGHHHHPHHHHSEVNGFRLYLTIGLNIIITTAEIIGGIISGSMLVICFLLVKEAIVRFFHPEPIQGKIMLIVATIGLVANLFSMLLPKIRLKRSCTTLSELIM